MQWRLISDVDGSSRIDNPRLRFALLSVKTIAVIFPRMRSQMRVAALAWSPSARLLAAACATSPGGPIHPRGNRLP